MKIYASWPMQGTMIPEGTAMLNAAKQALDEIKLGGHRIDLYRTQGTAEKSWSRLYEEARNKLKNPPPANAEVSR